MRIAIIDLGTNSVRFDVHQIGPSGTSRLHREKLMVRLGHNVFLTGRLDSEAKTRTLQALLGFRRTMQSLHVKKTVAFATSAMREAEDRDQFLKDVRKKTGIDVQIISGTEEARLIALGILSHANLPRGKFALVDIGGGSTEVTICQGKSTLYSHSFSLGAARLQQIFLKQSPPRAESIQKLRLYIRDELKKVLARKGSIQVDHVIGSSGTIRALLKMLDAELHGRSKACKHTDIRDLVRKMTKMNRSQLLKIPAIEPKRVDIILAGAVLLDETVDVLGANTITATDYSLRDGILAEEIELFRRRTNSHIAFHLPDIEAKVARLGSDPTRLTKAVFASELLFGRFRQLHKLDKDWQTYLVAAAMLKDAGEPISFVRHEEHSYYIAKNADIPSILPWESEFIAQLCRLHEVPKLSKKDLPFKQEQSKQRAYLKILALLQIVDALDCGVGPDLPLERIRVDRRYVRFYFSRKAVADLEMLRLERKKKLFEKVYRRQVLVERL